MFQEELEKIHKEYGIGGSNRFFNFKKGDNRIRLLAGGKAIASHYVGKYITCFGVDNGCPYHKDGAPKDNDGNPIKPRVRFIFYLLDKSTKNNEILVGFMPYTVVKALDVLAKNEDYKFNSLPMPYDITISYDPDVAPADMYKVIPSPRLEPVSQEVLDKLAAEKPVEEIIENMKEKSKREILKGVDKNILTAAENNDILIADLEDEEIRPEDLPF